MTGRMIGAWRRPWTLRRQLVFGVSGLVMAVLLTVGVMTVLTLRASVTSIVDTQLAGSRDALSHAVVKYKDPSSPSGVKPLAGFIGQAPGNLIAVIRDGTVLDSALFTDEEASPAPPEVVRDIESRSWTDHTRHTVALDGLGNFRMQSQPGPGGDILLSGVSLARADQAVRQETITVAVLTAVALLLTALGTVFLVRVALRPLGRVTGTAAEVATLPLGRGDPVISTRVREGDTDPRTEVGLVGDTLNRLLDHVDSAFAERAATDRRMRQFITDASHELRTPLAAIQGYAELTRQDSAKLPATTEYSLARIEAEAQRMNSLVSDLLLLARLDEGQDLEKEDVDLADVAVDAVNDAAVSAPNHRWSTRVPEDAVWIRGDREKVHQLLANLLSNARVHTPEGTTVTTGIGRHTGEDGTAYAELTVTDDGPGIDPVVLPHLFERFVRADKSRSRRAGSNGLGLSIAASIAEAHGGTIGAESVPGETTFRVRLPMTAPPRQPALPQPLRRPSTVPG